MSKPSKLFLSYADSQSADKVSHKLILKLAKQGVTAPIRYMMSFSACASAKARWYAANMSWLR